MFHQLVDRLLYIIKYRILEYRIGLPIVRFLQSYCSWHESSHHIQIVFNGVNQQSNIATQNKTESSGDSLKETPNNRYASHFPIKIPLDWEINFRRITDTVKVCETVIKIHFNIPNWPEWIFIVFRYGKGLPVIATITELRNIKYIARLVM